MSTYSKTTDFAAKDALATGNANKIVKGTEIDDEFDAIQTAVNSKANTNNAVLTGAPTAPTASFGTDSTQISTTAFVQAAMAAVYPVGSVYSNAAVATNPATLLGFSGTTGAEGAHTHFTHNLDASSSTMTDSNYPARSYDPGSRSATVNTATSTVATVGLTTEAPTHTHSLSGNVDSQGTGDGVNANIQPYITVYMWKRTA